jgi:putative membrane protein
MAGVDSQRRLLSSANKPELTMPSVQYQSVMTTLRDLAGIYLRGIGMGAADAVPGVSGGTIALITGIYERLIGAVTAIEPDRLRQILSGVHTENRPEAIEALREIDTGFLLALGAGIATAVVTILRVVEILLETNPVETYGFFFGLIGASAAVLYSEVSLSTRGRQGAAAAGFLVAFVLSGYAASTFGSSLPIIFVAGAVAVSAMVLPGVSGSLLLLMLGQYEYMSSALSQFTDALVAGVNGGGTETIVDTGVPVVMFMAGGVVGLFTVAHSVRWALEHYREATLAFLVSLIVGALRAPVEQTSLELVATGATWTAQTIGIFCLFGVAGAGAVVLVDRLAGGIETGQSTSV